MTNYDAILNENFGKRGMLKRNPEPTTASRVLVDARKEVGVTQSDLVSRVGVSQSYISRIENGAIKICICS